MKEIINNNLVETWLKQENERLEKEIERVKDIARSSFITGICFGVVLCFALVGFVRTITLILR